jgi:D-sedoheptulose 7-phosphate isomerase
MLNLNERVRTLFAHDIEGKIALVDVLSNSIAQAAQRLVDCLLSDGKIFIGGHGGSAANCLHFSTAMLHCFEVERPSLPVINLAGNGVVATAMTENGQSDQVFAQQVQALGQANDVVIILTTAGRSKAMINVVSAAHDKQMRVIALTGRDGGGLRNQLNANDIELRIPGDSSARIRETHLFILHCFCDVIDRSLFGCDAD